MLEEFSRNKDNVYGLIVGAGPLEHQIVAEIENLNLTGRVIMTGLQENTRPYFNAMNVFMMTSSFEGLPIALLEAMSMECALVSTDAGGIKEVIRDDEDGLLVNVEDWRCLPGKLELLYHDNSLLMKYAIAARKRVIENFSLYGMVQEIEDEYLNLVK